MDGQERKEIPVAHIAWNKRDKKGLDTVFEASLEMSAETTERLRRSLRASQQRGPSPFVVERYDYSVLLEEDEDSQTAERKNELINEEEDKKEEEWTPVKVVGGRHEKERRDSAQIGSTGNIAAGLKSGFFSVRKRSGKGEGGEAVGIQTGYNGGGGLESMIGGGVSIPVSAQGGKIKIVNNIFHNPILQHIVKSPRDPCTNSLKKNLFAAGNSNTGRSGSKRKANMSVDSRDTAILSGSGQPHHQWLGEGESRTQKRGAVVQVATQGGGYTKTGREKNFSFHGATSIDQKQSEAYKVGESPRNAQQHFGDGGYRGFGSVINNGISGTKLGKGLLDEYSCLNGHQKNFVGNQASQRKEKQMNRSSLVAGGRRESVGCDKEEVKKQRMEVMALDKKGAINEICQLPTKSDPGDDVAEMRKFHTRLGKLINELGCSEYVGENGEVSVRDQWRFVKDMARKCMEATQKVQMFEAILKMKP